MDNSVSPKNKEEEIQKEEEEKKDEKDRKGWNQMKSHGYLLQVLGDKNSLKKEEIIMTLYAIKGYYCNRVAQFILNILTISQVHMTTCARLLEDKYAYIRLFKWVCFFVQKLKN